MIIDLPALVKNPTTQRIKDVKDKLKHVYACIWRIDFLMH